jgi:pyruvate,water dikinase
MIQELSPLGVAVPGGFAVSATAYDAVLNQKNLRKQLQQLMTDLDVTNLKDLAQRGQDARHLIMQAGLPPMVRQQIEHAYHELSTNTGETSGSNNHHHHHPVEMSVAVRSSATAEDLPTASFAGQQASFLNVVGAQNVADAVLECLASVFTDRAITYRVHNHFDHMQIKGAVVVQRMVRSDLASSGVAFTLDPDTGFRDVVVLTGTYAILPFDARIQNDNNPYTVLRLTPCIFVFIFK